MADNKVIAVIGLPTLTTMGVKGIVHSYADVRVNSYAEFEEFRKFDEKAEGFVVTAEVFVCNLDFFMPRRSKTLIYGDFPKKGVKLTPETERSVNDFTDKETSGKETNLILYPYDDEAVTGEKVTRLIESLETQGEGRGELSTREREVLRLLVEGKINKEIADELCISINTVITHRKNITAKTGIKSVSGLSIFALMNGLT